MAEHVAAKGEARGRHCLKQSTPDAVSNARRRIRPEQFFCGQCGASLVLKEYISGQVAKEIANSVRDRDVIEIDSAVKVFERAFRWAKLTFGFSRERSA